MPTLAEITSSPEALQRAAEEFVAFHSSQTKSTEDMNKGIENAKQFIELMDSCGTDESINYEEFCEIGKDD